MAGFNVGEKYSGRVINIFQDNLIVELGNDVVGRVEGGARQEGVVVGSRIDVVINQFDNFGILLDFVSLSNEASSKRTNEAYMGEHWDNWMNMSAGHDQSLAALNCLYNHTAAARNYLREVKEEWDNSRNNSQKIFEAATAQATQEYTNACKKYEDEWQLHVKNASNQKEQVKRMAQHGQDFVNEIAGYGGAHGAANAASGAMMTVHSKQKVLIEDIDKKIQAYRQLHQCQVADSERVRNDKLDKAKAEQNDRDTQSERKYKAKFDQCSNDLVADISKGFSKSAIHAYQQDIRSSRFNAINYECRTEVPEYIMLGDIGLIIPAMTQDDNVIVQAVDLQASEVSSKESGRYIVKIPYAQRLSDGISLLMRYLPSERDFVQDLIQPLLFKLFLSFPAGKIEATMIDPLELGASFSDITKLGAGPNSSRIIDTKVWSKEKDIEVAIATLRQRLENMTQSYGNDKESRLKKEAVRTLAITDFPVNFSDTALKDLHAIVRNSADLGVCVFICANDEELEKLKQKNANLVAEITQSVIETKAVGGKLMLTQNNQMFIELDNMKDVFERKDTIISLFSNAVEHSKGKIEPFDDMFNFDIYDSNNWFMGNHDEISIPIGIKGADNVINMVMGRSGGSTEHHALIAGMTGAGKSTFFHTLIMSTLISYSPDEVQMYLLDFKEGVEFSAYTRYRLPSLRVVAIDSEREFGLNVLKELCNELEIRSKHFARYGVADINGYFELSDVPKVPKLLLIFDEVQELFRSQGESDNISAECLSCINKLVMQGRAMGIHIILACQDFRNCSGLESYFSQMSIRIAISGNRTGNSSILSSDNDGPKALEGTPAGTAIYNGGGGVQSANTVFQISYINEEERLELLTRLDAYYSDFEVAELYKDQQTRILLTNAEENIHNCFNELILNGSASIQHLGSSQDGYGLLLGQGFGKKSLFMPELRAKDRDNLLVVTRDEKMALSLFELAAMSFLYEELHTNADKANALIYVVDLFVEPQEWDEGSSDFEFLEQQFPQQVKVAKIGDAEELINSLYEIVLARSEGRLPSTERLFFMFFGINRARLLRTGRLYDEDREGELTTMDKLQKIIAYGPKYGVNSVVWSESLNGVGLMLGERYEAMFDKRIAYDLDDDAMDILVAETQAKSLRGKTAVYMDIAKDVKNTHFRPYDVPAKIWVEQYARVYDETINEGGI